MFQLSPLRYVNAKLRSNVNGLKIWKFTKFLCTESFVNSKQTKLGDKLETKFLSV